MASILNSLEEVENERGLSLWQIDEEGKNETGTDLHRLWLRPRNLRLFVVHGVFTCLEFSFGLGNLSTNSEYFYAIRNLISFPSDSHVLRQRAGDRWENLRLSPSKGKIRDVH